MNMIDFEIFQWNVETFIFTTFVKFYAVYTIKNKIIFLAVY